MAAAVLVCLPELTLHSNHHHRWRGWLDRSVDVAVTYAKYIAAVDQQWPVHCVCDTGHFLGLSNEGIAMVRACIRANSALDTVLGGLRGGHGAYWRLALTPTFLYGDDPPQSRSNQCRSISGLCFAVFSAGPRALAEENE